MAELDPYFQSIQLTDSQVIQTCRPITLTQNSTDPGEVNLPADKDVVVFADVVTVRGPIQIRHPPTKPPPDGTQGGASGARLVILARQLATLTGKGDAKLDVSGDAGDTSTKTWAAPPPPGKAGDPGVEGGFLSKSTPGGNGQSSADASGKVDPNSPLHGKPGDPGGAGGVGGSVELRCGSLAATDPGIALAVDVSGGAGGNGLAGQPGAAGGKGADGIGVDGRSTAPSAGGNGGRGGNGGAGGAPGPGGAPGSVWIWLRSGSASGITIAANAGAPGKPGAGGTRGGGGAKGMGGYVMGRGIANAKPDGQPGPDGDDGPTPATLEQGAPAKPVITTACADASLVAKLTQPLSPQLAMMLDLMRTDYLKATGSSDSDALGEFADRLDWVSALATAYVPLDPTEEAALDAVRARIQVMHEHLKHGSDHFGHVATFAPLGALSSYQDRFHETLDVLRELRSKYDTNLKALDAATVTTDELRKAVNDLTDDLNAYTRGEAAERAAISELVTRINGHDSDAVSTKQALVEKATDEFKAAVRNACPGLKVEDLIEVVGQFAFLGEHQPQQMAMYTSQAAKLIETAGSTCLADDGTKVDRRWLINQLANIDDLSKALESYSGTIGGIKLSDPGAVKLLGKQAELDALCTKFWSYHGARELKHAFEDYVAAVQARNADILALNGSLARLRGYLAGAAQCAASIAQAEDKEGRLAAPGAPALVSQLARMVARATDDCIYWLYLVSRAYWMWSRDPDDELAKQLREIGGTDPLALTPEDLAGAAERMSTDFAKVFDKQLSDAGAWVPPPAHEGVWYPAPDERGTRVEFTHKTHPAFIEALRDKKKRSATVAIAAPRLATPAAESPFSGYADVRITKVRPWVFGARLTSKTPAKHTLRVDLTHTGRETIVSPDDSVTVITHDPVYLAFEYALDRPDDPAAIQTDGELFATETHTPGTLVGPFTRWRVAISDRYNDASLDTSGIDKVVLEFFFHQRPYPVKAREAPAAAAAGSA